MYADRVEETTTTQGVGDLALGGAPAGRRTFITGIGAGNSAYAVCTDGQSEWEIFEGVVSAGSPPTISRATILASTNGGSAVNWGPGIKTVQCVPVAESFGSIGNRHRWCGTLGGTAGAYTGQVRPIPRALIDGMIVYGKANHDSPSTGSTFNLNSKGAKPVVVRDGSVPIREDDIVANQVIELLYDQSSDTWRLLSAYGLDEITTIISTDPGIGDAGPIFEAYRAAQLVLSMGFANFRASVQNTSGTKITVGDEYYNVTATTLGAESVEKVWQTMQAGSLAYRAKLANGLIMGTPTGGDKGLGTINASGVYDDNTLLTCYPLALAINGRTDPGLWDARANRGRHKGARRFLRRWREWLDPKSYATFWREHGHLPEMPSPREWEEREHTIPLGELTRRLWEVCDVQAVHIDKLLKRIEALEAKNERG